jgi:hypothetical protein
MESVITYPSSVLGLAALAAVVGVSPAAFAQSDPYHITANEKAACTSDAVRLCMDAYPDEHKLISCMASNRASLSGTCLAVFDAGVRRRRLVSR